MVTDYIYDYKVVASTHNGVFHSNPMSGYSTDNIAPEVPSGLFAVQDDINIVLNWNSLDINDLDYYSIYRSENSEFEPSEET